LQININTTETFLQDDFYGRENPWRAKKVANEYLSLAYKKIDERKAQRLLECSTHLFFKKFDDGSRKLHSMNSCRVRLCPLCTWRRTLRVYADNKRIFDFVNSEKKYKFVLLTLTEKNCKAEDLSKRIDALFYAWKLFSKTKPFKQAVKGWYRGLEVTHNTDFLSKNYDTYHPHFHVILAVNKSYFTSRYYLSQPEWVKLWRSALSANYDPVVDVRKINDLAESKTVAEVSKYPIKDGDYIIYDDWDLTFDTVATLDTALSNRRLIAYGGILKDAKKALKIDDIENADLVHLDDEPGAEPDDNFVLEYFFWHTGYRQYLKGEN
jgi:plasmid rolling circle replication initiator protein Rep